MKNKTETLSGNKPNEEAVVRGFYEFVKQGGYFDKKNSDQIEAELELYIARKFPTAKTTEQIKKEAVEDFGKFVLKRCNEGILTGSVHSLIDAEIIEYLEKGQNE